MPPSPRRVEPRSCEENWSFTPVENGCFSCAVLRLALRNLRLELREPRLGRAHVNAICATNVAHLSEPPPDAPERARMPGIGPREYLNDTLRCDDRQPASCGE